MDKYNQQDLQHKQTDTTTAPVIHRSSTALNGDPSQSHRAPPATQDHTVLPDTC